MPERWNDRAYLQPVQFEYEDSPRPRDVRGPALQVGDPVRVAIAGVEVEGRIVEIADAVLHVRIGQRLF
jgi:hypothetical protein